MAPARGGGPHSDAGELALAQMTGSRDGPKRERNGQRRRKRGIMLLAVFFICSNNGEVVGADGYGSI